MSLFSSQSLLFLRVLYLFTNCDFRIFDENFKNDVLFLRFCVFVSLVLQTVTFEVLTQKSKIRFACLTFLRFRKPRFANCDFRGFDATTVIYYISFLKSCLILYSNIRYNTHPIINVLSILKNSSQNTKTPFFDPFQIATNSSFSKRSKNFKHHFSETTAALLSPLFFQPKNTLFFLTLFGHPIRHVLDFLIGSPHPSHWRRASSFRKKGPRFRKKVRPFKKKVRLFFIPPTHFKRSQFSSHRTLFFISYPITLKIIP
jgi:hypothetical protein